MATITDKKVFNNVLEAIGDTPMVRINRITKGMSRRTVFAKIETFNPGNSIKDRMAVRMIEDAERRGCSSLAARSSRGPPAIPVWAWPSPPWSRAIAASSRPPTSSRRRRSTRCKAFGAEVIVCPTNVDPEDPRSYYSVSSRLEQEIPNSWKANQYDNLSNSARAL